MPGHTHTHAHAHAQTSIFIGIDYVTFKSVGQTVRNRIVGSLILILSVCIQLRVRYPGDEGVYSVYATLLS
jgi:hypothetical protein